MVVSTSSDVHKAPSSFSVKSTNSSWKVLCTVVNAVGGFSLLPRIRRKHHHFLIYTVQLALQTFRCRLYQIPCHSQFVSQPRCYACSLYVEDLCPRGRQGRGATISCGWWLFCLGCHPWRQGERGQDGGSQESKICCTAQRTSVWWSWTEWAVVLVKNKREPFILYPSVTVWISHKPFAGIQAMASDGLWCRFHLTELTAELMSVSLWSRRTKRQTRLFLRLWDEWCFPSSLWGACWSKILCSSIVNDSGDFVTLGVL